MDESWVDTVRLVRDHGDVTQLFPDGCDSILDLPYTLFDALRQAAVFLSWDELPLEERPPKHIWRDGDRLKEWFDDVNEKRQHDMNPDKHIEDPVQNDAARSLVVG